MKTNTAIILCFFSDLHYLPAKQFVSLMTNRFQVYGLKGLGATSTNLINGEWVNLNLNSQRILSEEFESAETAIIFITPTDLSEVVSLTRSCIDIAQKKGIRRLAWLAPACPTGTKIGERLTEAENLVRGLKIETLILRHAPLFSHLLLQKKDLRLRRTLSLPLGNTALPWLEPEAIAFGLSKWVQGEINNPPPEILTGSSQISGADIALALSAMLRQSMSAQQFARLRFDAIDLDQSGQIDAQELLPYLLDLGYSHEQCQSVLEEADKDGSGTIDFDEFVYGLENHRLKDGKIASLSVRGRWSGRRLAIQLFFEDRILPRWQVALFRELGELQIEEVSAADEFQTKFDLSYTQLC